MSLVDLPAKVHGWNGIRPHLSAVHHRAHAGVNVALICVGFTHPSGGIVPPGLIKKARIIICAPNSEHPFCRTQDRLGLYAKRVESLDVLVGEAPAPGGLERPKAIARTLLHRQIDQRLSARTIDPDRVLQHLRIEIPLRRIQRRNPLAYVARKLVSVELSFLEPQEPLRLRFHRGNDILV